MEVVTRLESILLMGREHLKMSGDDKLFVYESDMRILLGADSRVIQFNGPQIGGRYVTEVEYRGVIFVTTTTKPIGFGLPVA